MVGLVGDSLQLALCPSILWDSRLSPQALATLHPLPLPTSYICIVAGSPGHEGCGWERRGLLVAPPSGRVVVLLLQPWPLQTHIVLPQCLCPVLATAGALTRTWRFPFLSKLSFLTSFRFLLNSAPLTPILPLLSSWETISHAHVSILIPNLSAQIP